MLLEKSELTKEKILEQTISLIKENDGDTNRITIRKIAERSEVGVGLINHYFESKEKLIECCVQRIINGVIFSFKPDVCESLTRVDRIKLIAKLVMDFLMSNQQISRISILGDMSNPKELDNTTRTVLGFARSGISEKPSDEDIHEAFIFTSILQESFLRRDLLKKSMNVDFYEKKERDLYIDRIIDTVYGTGGLR